VLEVLDNVMSQMTSDCHEPMMLTAAHYVTDQTLSALVNGWTRGADGRHTTTPVIPPDLHPY